MDPNEVSEVGNIVGDVDGILVDSFPLKLGSWEYIWGESEGYDSALLREDALVCSDAISERCNSIDGDDEGIMVSFMPMYSEPFIVGDMCEGIDGAELGIFKFWLSCALLLGSEKSIDGDDEGIMVAFMSMYFELFIVGDMCEGTDGAELGIFKFWLSCALPSGTEKSIDGNDEDLFMMWEGIDGIGVGDLVLFFFDVVGDMLGLSWRGYMLWHVFAHKCSLS